MSAHKIINSLLSDKGMSKRDFFKEVGRISDYNVAENTFYAYLSGFRAIPQELQIPMSKVLGVSISEIFGSSDALDILKEYLKNPSKEAKKIISQALPQINPDTISVPIKNIRFGAGNGGVIDEEFLDTTDYKEIDKTLIPNGASISNLFFGTISGHSMEPKFYEGDLVMVEKKINYEAPMTDNYYFINYDGLFQIKYLSFPDSSETVYIISENQQFPTIVHKRSETQIQFDILGRVIMSIRAIV